MTNPARISAVFARLKAAGQLAFMPFVTAGDPDVPTTTAVIRKLAQCGVDLIEVGFPYSDPIADGPVIQASYTRALHKKVHVDDIFQGIGELETNALPPLVAMVSYALLFRRGPQEFVRRAAQSGFAGLIVPDLPADEASDLSATAHAHGLDLIQLIAPTTSHERARRILQAASGFVYCISVAGITGVRNELPAELRDQLRWLRSQTDLPLAVGFGISQPEQVEQLRDVADGVIVGSAIVRYLESINQSCSPDTALAHIGSLAESLVSATHTVSR